MSGVASLKAAVGRARWAIAIYAGDDPLSLAPAPGAGCPVLTRRSVTDANASFVADPFMIEVAGLWHMFFEALVWRSGRRVGVIGHATSPDGLRWAYDRIVLSEPFHLSYPQIVRQGDALYMLPETEQAGALRLYRADPFPSRWTLDTEILKEPVFDATPFEHEGRWWMFAAAGRRSDTLRLLHAPTLRGPWVEHPQSPLLERDARRSRPAGPVVRAGGRLLRFAQDCEPAYGTGVRAFEILRLDEAGYEERALGDRVLGPGRGWNRRGMHHLDAHALPGGRWLACVDGWYRGVAGPDELRVRLRRS